MTEGRLLLMCVTVVVTAVVTVVARGFVHRLSSQQHPQARPRLLGHHRPGPP